MSYIQETMSEQEFLQSIASRNHREMTKSILNQFNLFCNCTYSHSKEDVLADLVLESKENNNSDKIYTMLNQFKLWLLEDHPDLFYYCGKNHTQKRPIKKRHANTVKVYLQELRNYLEVHNLEINERKFRKRVKVPKAEEEDPEPFTREEIRLLLDRCSNSQKLLYMVLKDSGMRIGETVQLRKKDIDVTKNPVEIHIQANYSKTKKARITFVTRETAPMLKRLLSGLQDDELVFGTNNEPYIAVHSEITLFRYYRKELGKTYPKFLERYESNDRHKKNIHSLRAFTATQCAESVDESFGHGLIGHKKYLQQYIRNQDKMSEKYLRAENTLMIYETVEIVDSDETVKTMQKDVEKLQKMVYCLQKYAPKTV